MRYLYIAILALSAWLGAAAVQAAPATQPVQVAVTADVTAQKVSWWHNRWRSHHRWGSYGWHNRWRSHHRWGSGWGGGWHNRWRSHYRWGSRRY